MDKARRMILGQPSWAPFRYPPDDINNDPMYWPGDMLRVYSVLHRNPGGHRVKLHVAEYGNRTYLTPGTPRLSATHTGLRVLEHDVVDLVFMVTGYGRLSEFSRTSCYFLWCPRLEMSLVCAKWTMNYHLGPLTQERLLRRMKVYPWTRHKR